MRKILAAFVAITLAALSPSAHAQSADVRLTRLEIQMGTVQRVAIDQLNVSAIQAEITAAVVRLGQPGLSIGQAEGMGELVDRLFGEVSRLTGLSDRARRNLLQAIASAKAQAAGRLARLQDGEAEDSRLDPSGVAVSLGHLGGELARMATVQAEINGRLDALGAPRVAPDLPGRK